MVVSRTQLTEEFWAIYQSDDHEGFVQEMQMNMCLNFLVRVPSFGHAGSPDCSVGGRVHGVVVVVGVKSAHFVLATSHYHVQEELVGVTHANYPWLHALC